MIEAANFIMDTYHPGDRERCSMVIWEDGTISFELRCSAEAQRSTWNDAEPCERVLIELNCFRFFESCCKG
jgi:hypothetical protein